MEEMKREVKCKCGAIIPEGRVAVLMKYSLQLMCIECSDKKTDKYTAHHVTEGKSGDSIQVIKDKKLGAYLKKASKRGASGIQIRLNSPETQSVISDPSVDSGEYFEQKAESAKNKRIRTCKKS